MVAAEVAVLLDGVHLVGFQHDEVLAVGTAVGGEEVGELGFIFFQARLQVLHHHLEGPAPTLAGEVLPVCFALRGVIGVGDAVHTVGAVLVGLQRLMHGGSEEGGEELCLVHLHLLILVLDGLGRRTVVLHLLNEAVGVPIGDEILLGVIVLLEGDGGELRVGCLVGSAVHPEGGVRTGEQSVRLVEEGEQRLYPLGDLPRLHRDFLEEV